jgi:hypothetical protein
VRTSFFSISLIQNAILINFSFPCFPFPFPTSFFQYDLHKYCMMLLAMIITYETYKLCQKARNMLIKVNIGIVAQSILKGLQPTFMIMSISIYKLKKRKIRNGKILEEANTFLPLSLSLSFSPAPSLFLLLFVGFMLGISRRSSKGKGFNKEKQENVILL